MKKEITIQNKYKKSNQNSRLLVRSLEILECISCHEAPIGIREISVKTDLPVATVHRITHTLCHYGWLYQDRDSKFTIGLRTYIIGVKYNLIDDLRRIASYIMQKTSNELQQPVNLMIRDGNETVLIEQTSSENVYHTLSPVGSRRPLYLTACGKMIISDLLPTEKELLLDSFQYHAYTPYSPLDKATVYNQLERIKAKGWALDNQETMLGAFCVGTGIRMEGRIIAGLSVTSVIAHEHRIFDYADRIKKAAVEIEMHFSSYCQEKTKLDFVKY